MKYVILLAFVCLFPGICSAAPVKAEVQRIPLKELKELKLPEHVTIATAEEVIFALTPEKWEELKTLRKKDPAAAAEYLVKEVEARRERRMELTRKINETARLVRKEKDPAQKALLTAELKKLLKQDYERVTNEITNRVRLQEVRLESIRDGLRKRLSAEEHAIQKQLEQMVQPRSKTGKNDKTTQSAAFQKTPQSNQKD